MKWSFIDKVMVSKVVFWRHFASDLLHTNPNLAEAIQIDAFDHYVPNQIRLSLQQKKVHFNLILVYLGFKTFSHAESVDHTIWPKVLQEVEVEQNERRPVSTSWYQVPSPSSTMRPALVCITFYWRGCSRLSTRGTYSACHPARSARVPP